MSVCISIEDIQAATLEDAHLQKLKLYIMHGHSHKKRWIRSEHQALLVD